MAADYTPEQRRRNRVTISCWAGVPILLLVWTGFVRDRPIISTIGYCALVMVLALPFWLSFASRSARPFQPANRQVDGGPAVAVLFQHKGSREALGRRSRARRRVRKAAGSK